MNLKKLLINNFWLKILALVFAIATWTTVNELISISKLFKVPVSIQHADNMILISRSIDYLTLKVKGPAGRMNSISPDSFTIAKDLTDLLQPGTITIPVQDLDISIPNHLTIENFFPTRMTVKLDRIIEKEFKVTVVTTGSPSAGYTLLDNHRVNPTIITLIGPEQLITNMDTINTEPISVSGLVASKRFPTVRLQPFLPNHNLNKDKFVEVTIRILEKNIKRSFAKIPVQTLGAVKAPYNIETAIHEVDVILRGQGKVLDSVDPSEITIFFDITDLGVGVYDLPLEGRIPEKFLLQGVHIQQITPTSIETTISEKE